MTGWRAVREVARREVVERSRSRVMRVSMVLLLVLSIGGAIAAARLSGRTPTDDVAVVGSRSHALQPAIERQATAAGRRVRLHALGDAVAAAQAVRDGAVDVALLNGDRIVVKRSDSQPAVRVLQGAVAAQAVLTRLRGFGLSELQARKLLTPQALPVEVLEPQPPNVERNRGLVLAGLLALFMALIFYGQAVAQGVTEEKSSRVVELLLTTVSPRRLLTGKVLGIGLLGLAQLLIAGAVALAAGRLAGGAGLPSAAPKAVGLVLLWFVLGYAFYSVAFAAVGSLVSRQEDLQTAIVPITVLMTGAFYLALIAANTNPNGALATVTAFVPPFAPMVVPARMLLGHMTATALGIAVVLELAAIAGLIALAAIVYERAILRIGAPVRLRGIVSPRRADASPAVAKPNGARTMKRENAEQTDLDPDDVRRSHVIDVVMRVGAVALLLAGAAIGLSHPVAIGLMVLGLLFIALLESRKHRRRRVH